MTKVEGMPFKILWEKELTADLGATTARNLMNRIEAKYFELRAGHPVSNEVLKKHLYGNIFPQMAAFKIFLEDKISLEDALTKTQKLHILTLKKERDKYETLGKLPFIFPIIRIIIKPLIKKLHPPEGWKIEYRENSKNRVDVRVHSCFYHEIAKQYQMPEFITIYCKGDDYVYAEVECPYIGWGRVNSIAVGSDYCDVIYYRKPQK